MVEHQLICPECHRGDELRVIESTQFERHITDVTTSHTEYGDEATDPTYNEIGIACGHCSFRQVGSNWKAVLEKGEVVK